MKVMVFYILYSILGSFIMFLGFLSIRTMISFIDGFIYYHGNISIAYSSVEFMSDLKLSIFWGVGVGVVTYLYKRFGRYQ